MFLLKTYNSVASFFLIPSELFTFLYSGSGGYCDDSIGGVSSTGHGESISRVCLAHRITMLMEEGMTEEYVLNYSKQ